MIKLDLPREEVQKIFDDACSEISERCWAAGWMAGIENYMPILCERALVGEISAWGMDGVMAMEASLLTHLSEALGGWEKAFQGSNA